MSEFKFIDRGAVKTILLIPGWASDYRIFDRMEIAANYLLPVNFSPSGFNRDFDEAVERNKLGRFSVVGWSMGGFLAFDLLSGYGDRIDALTLISVRGSYAPEEIAGVRELIKKNRKAFLFKFYNECFCAEESSESSFFRKNLMKPYLNELNMDTLLEGLDYLSRSRITADVPKSVKIKFVHGENDRIAPVGNARALKANIPDSELIIIKGAGHIPFLKKDFNEVIGD